MAFGAIRGIPKMPKTRTGMKPMPKFAQGGMTSRGAGVAQKGFDYNIYAEGGKVNMASGGSCRGMGSAVKGGKYSIK